MKKQHALYQLFGFGIFTLIVFLVSCISVSNRRSSRWIEIEPQTTLSETLDLAIDTNVKDSEPGIAMMVFQGGEVIYEHYKGMANIDRNLPIQGNTGFRLASVSKTFTALAILQLYENGKLSLDDSIRDYLPDVPENWERITIHDLLSHRSGIPDFLNDESSIPEVLDNDYVRNEYIHKRTLEFEPGESFDYSNTGYVLLAEIVTAVSGLNFDDYMDRYIFAPLDMQDSFIYDGDLGEHSLNALNFGLTEKIYGRDATFTGSSSQVSSLHDMQKFITGLLEERIVTKETLGLLRTPYSDTRDESNYGYGIYNSNAGQTSFHTGRHDGFAIAISIHWDSNTSIIILQNGGKRESADILLKLAGPFLQ